MRKFSSLKICEALSNSKNFISYYWLIFARGIASCWSLSFFILVQLAKVYLVSFQIFSKTNEKILFYIFDLLSFISPLFNEELFSLLLFTRCPEHQNKYYSLIYSNNEYNYLDKYYPNSLLFALANRKLEITRIKDFYWILQYQVALRNNNSLNKNLKIENNWRLSQFYNNLLQVE